MAHSPQHSPVSPEALELGYQPEGNHARWLGIFLVLFIVTVVAVHVLVWYVMKVIESDEARADVPQSVLTLDSQPPPPNLQPSVGHDSLDKQDLEVLRQREDTLFIKLGWTVNPQTHEVDIPPEIARRVAQEAQARARQPAVPPTTTGKDTNSTVPGPVPVYDTRPGINGGQRP